MRNAGLEEAQAGIKIAGRNINNLRRPGFDPWIGKIPWRKEWLPTPVCWPGEFHGQRSLADTVHEITKSQTLSD